MTEALFATSTQGQAQGDSLRSSGSRRTVSMLLVSVQYLGQATEDAPSNCIKTSTLKALSVSVQRAMLGKDHENTFIELLLLSAQALR